MDFNALMSKVMSVTKVPSTFFEEKLLNGIKYSNKAAHVTFFSSEPGSPFLTLNAQPLSPLFEELSVKYFSYIVSKVSAYNFNRTVSATESTINQWFSKNSSKIGQNILVDYMMEPQLLGPIFKDPNFNITDMADKMSNRAFLNGLLLQTDTLGSNLPVQILMLMLKLLDKNGDQYKRVYDLWSKNERWKEFQVFDTYGWLDSYRDLFKQEGKIFNKIFAVVMASAVVPTVTKYTKNEGTFISQFDGKQYANSVNYTKTVYGQSLMAWINSESVKFSLRTGSGPSNVSNVKDGIGCVIAGTLITLQDGTKKPIEEIVAGDLILASGGSIATSSGEILANPHLESIYSINDDEPFMSLDHTMMTQRGWCSMAPKLSHEITPHLEIGTLSVGDVVWKIIDVKDGLAQYDKIEVKKINIKEVMPEDNLMGYILHQRGHHINHVNGYCCHSGYPEISMQFISGNVASKMTIREQIKFNKEIEKLSPQFEKALGKGVTDMVIASLKNANAISSQADHTSPNGKIECNYKKAKNIILPKMNMLHIGGEESITNSISEFGLYQGHCFIDGVITDSKTSDKNVYWERDVNGVTEYGVIKMLDHGLRGIGRITRGAQSCTFAAEGSLVYDIMVGPGQEKWLQFTLDYSKDDDGESFISGRLSSYNEKSNSDKIINNSKVLISHEDNLNVLDALHVQVMMNAHLGAFGICPYIRADFSLTNNYKYFHGVVHKFEESNNNFVGEAIDITGQLEDTSFVDLMKSEVTKKMMNLPVQLDFTHVQPTSLKKSIESENAAFASADLPVDVNLLYGLPAPDLTMVHDTGFAKLKDLMMLALSKSNPDMLKMFQETAPSVGVGMDLNQTEANLINDEKIKSFLVDKFAIGYLTQSFSKSDDDKIKPKFDALKNVDEKLSYFWKGDGDTSFAKDPGYNRSTSTINDFVYASSVPELEQFMEDNPSEWAKKLYDYCTKKEVLLGLSLTSNLGQRKKLTHLSSMLHALDPKGRLEKKTNTTFAILAEQKKVSYSTALFQEVLGENLKNFSNNTLLGDEDEYNEFLLEYFKQYFARILDSSSAMSAEVRAEAKKELDELMRLTGAENSDALQAHLSSVIKSSVSFIFGLKNGPLGKRINDWAKGFSTENPKLGKVGKLIAGGLTMGTYAFGMFQVISSFMNFGTLNTEQKVSLVATTLDLSSSIFGDITAFKAARTLASSESSLEEVFNAISALEGITDDAQFFDALNAVSLDKDLIFAEFDSPAIAQAAEGLSGAINEAEEIASSAAKWSKISAVGEVLSRSFSIVALAAGAVVTGFQIANDFATNQPASIKALDIMQEVVMAVSFSLEVGSGIAALAGVEVAAAIPVVGAIIAAIGIIISIVLLFIHRKPPPSPVEIFVDQKCVPFINNLPMPPQKWLDAQKKILDHLSGDKKQLSLSALLSL